MIRGVGVGRGRKRELALEWKRLYRTSPERTSVPHSGSECAGLCSAKSHRDGLCLCGAVVTTHIARCCCTWCGGFCVRVESSRLLPLSCLLSCLASARVRKLARSCARFNFFAQRLRPVRPIERTPAADSSTTQTVPGVGNIVRVRWRIFSFPACSRVVVCVCVCVSLVREKLSPPQPTPSPPRQWWVG